jgi:hypothetical protein
VDTFPADAQHSEREDYIDVGAIRLSPRCAPEPSLTLADLELIVPQRSESDSFLVMGYPESKNRKSLKGEEFNAAPISFSCSGGFPN